MYVHVLCDLRSVYRPFLEKKFNMAVKWLNPIDECIRHFDPLHLWKPFQTQRGSKTRPFAPRARLQTQDYRKNYRHKLQTQDYSKQWPFSAHLCSVTCIHSRAPRIFRANFAPVGVFLDSPSPTRAKGGGGRHATPAVSPFIYVSLVSLGE